MRSVRVNRVMDLNYQFTNKEVTPWWQQIDNEGQNIYEIPEKELDYLVNFVKTNIGRGAVFAKIILCELYGICIETEGRKGELNFEP